jgi:hypothetical protein
MTSNFVDSIKMHVAEGELLLDVTPKFMDMVRQEYGLADGAPVSEEHVKMFLVTAMRNALESGDEEPSG